MDPIYPSVYDFSIDNEYLIIEKVDVEINIDNDIFSSIGEIRFYFKKTSFKVYAEFQAQFTKGIFDLMPNFC